MAASVEWSSRLMAAGKNEPPAWGRMDRGESAPGNMVLCSGAARREAYKRADHWCVGVYLAMEMEDSQNVEGSDDDDGDGQA